MKVNISEFITVELSDKGTLFDRVLKALTYNYSITETNVKAAQGVVIGQDLVHLTINRNEEGADVDLFTLDPRPKRDGKGEVVPCIMQRAKVTLRDGEIIISRWYHKVNLVINETQHGLRYFVSANKKIYWGGLRVHQAFKSVGMRHSWYASYGTELFQKYLEGRYAVNEFYPELQYYRQSPIKPAISIADTANPFLIRGLTGKRGAKAILNSIYSPKGEKFLSKSTFGGLGEIRDLTTLVNAMLTVKALRGFGPDFLAKMLRPITIPVTYDLPGAIKASGEVQRFFAMFGATEKTFGMLCPNGTVGDYEVDSTTYWDMKESLRMFQQITSRRIRSAVRAHLRGHNMTMSDLHDYISGELAKMEQVNMPIDVPELTAFEGVVNDEIVCVVPKWTHDLVQWGAEYNICIGSYCDFVRNGETYCLGFKKPDGRFWGFAEVKRNRELYQLLGKHNSNLPDEPRRAIEDYLKAKGVTIREGYWGAR